MFCNNCGKQIPDDAKFCDYCGTPIIKNNMSYSDQTGQLQGEQFDQNTQPQKQGGNGGLIAVIITLTALILIVILCVLLFITPGWLKNDDNSSRRRRDKTTEATSEVTTEVTTETTTQATTQATTEATTEATTATTEATTEATTQTPPQEQPTTQAQSTGNKTTDAILAKAKAWAGTNSAVVDGAEGDSIIIRCYDDMGDHQAASNYLTIDPGDLTGYDFYGNPVDLNPY